MKKMILSIGLLSTLFVGCNSIYKSQQTPDDLYYSPGQEIRAAEVRKYEKEVDEYQQYVSTMDDNYLRMKVANAARWSSIDNFSYWNDMRFGFNNPANVYNTKFGWGVTNPYNPWGIGWSNGWNLGFGVNAWNTWCPSPWGGPWSNGLYSNNPFYSVIVYANPKVLTPTINSGANLSAYRNRTYNNTNLPMGGGKGNYYTPGTQGDNNNFGNLVRRVFSSGNGGNNNGYSNSYDRAARTFSSNSSNGSTSTSSSAGGSSGGFSSSGSSASGGRGGRN